MNPARTRVLRAIGAACLACLPFAAAAQAFDSAHTHIGFVLHTRWGQQLEGRFPRYEGAVRALPDGYQQVTMRLATADVPAIEPLLQDHSDEVRRAAERAIQRLKVRGV